MYKRSATQRASGYGYCLATISLLFWLFCWSSPAASEPATTSSDILYVPKGWETPAPGYYLSEPAGRDIASGWSADRAERDYLRGALKNQLDRTQAYMASSSKRMDSLEKNVAVERASYADELKRKEAQIHKLRQQQWIPGIIIGGGITDRGEFRGVLGVGWKF